MDAVEHGRRLSADDRREHLLDVALRLAAGGDLTAVSVRDVAAAARVSTGLLYHYFPTKQALVEASLRRAADQLLDDLRRATAKRSGAAALAAALAVYLDHVEQHPTGWRALLQARSGALADIGEELEAEASAVLLAALGVREPGPRLTLALAGWAASEREVCLQWLDHPEVPREVVAEYLLSTFLDGLRVMARLDGQTRTALEGLAVPGPGPRVTSAVGPPTVAEVIDS